MKYRRSQTATTTWVTLLALACAAGPLAAGAAPAPAPAAPTSELVEVEVPKDLFEAELIDYWANEAAVNGLNDAGIRKSGQEHGRVFVKVEGEPYNYEVGIGIRREGAQLERFTSSKCQCNEDELVEHIRAHVKELAPRLRESPGQAEPMLRPEPQSDLPPDGRPVPKDDGASGLSGRGKAGVALLVVGGAATVTGLALVIVGKRMDIDDNSTRLRNQDFRVPGGVLLGTGIVGVAIGAGLLGADRSAAKKKLARISVAPMFGRDGGGIRFGSSF